MKLGQFKILARKGRRLALLTACLICLSPALAESPLQLPTWFWNPPNIPGATIAVGYSRPYYYPASSYTEAFEDAASRLLQDKECTIKAAMGSVTTGPETMSMGGIADIQSDTAGFAIFKEGLVHLDSCWSEDLVLMLVGTRKVKVDRDLIPPPEKQQKLKSADDYIIGKSTAEVYHFKTSSWQKAERYARRNLAIAANSHLQSLRSTQNQQLLKVVTVESAVHLSDIRTLGRYIDDQTGGCVVTVGIKKQNLDLAR